MESLGQVTPNINAEEDRIVVDGGVGMRPPLLLFQCLAWSRLEQELLNEIYKEFCVETGGTVAVDYLVGSHP